MSHQQCFPNKHRNTTLTETKTCSSLVQSSKNERITKIIESMERDACILFVKDDVLIIMINNMTIVIINLIIIITNIIKIIQLK